MTSNLGPILFDPTLAMAAENLNTLEDARKATNQRIQKLTDPVDQRGFGLDPRNPFVLELIGLAAELETSEKHAIKYLERIMNTHPLADWLHQHHAVGAKQLARLLGAIGDPYWNTRDNRPRTLRELYAYCGMHVHTQDGEHLTNPDQPGEAPRRRRGQEANWNAEARMRLWNMVESQVKATGGTTIKGVDRTPGHWRPLYDQARARYADAIHQTPCRRCGPQGKPAQAGTPLSLGHQNARAKRIVSKAILTSLYKEAKRIHQQQAGETNPDTINQYAIAS